MLPSCRSQEAWTMFFLFHSFLGTPSSSCVIHFSLKVNKQAATMSHWPFSCLSWGNIQIKPTICPNIDSSATFDQGKGCATWERYRRNLQGCCLTWSLIKIPTRIIWLMLTFRQLCVPVNTEAAFKQIHNKPVRSFVKRVNEISPSAKRLWVRWLRGKRRRGEIRIKKNDQKHLSETS